MNKINTDTRFLPAGKKASRQQSIAGRLKYIVIAILMSVTISCNSWLDIGSEDRIMEKELFSSPSGFMSALNGVYIELLNYNLYGATLTFRTFDILAQYYDCDVTEHSYKSLVTFDPAAKNRQVSGMWSAAYKLLVNVNTLIEACDNNRQVLDDQYYHVIKGEALALRAMLHFDLLRVFGPVYVNDPEKPCIPYADNSDLTVRPLLAASTVAGLVMGDLKQAESMLEGYDPVIKEGPLFHDAAMGVPNDMMYRPMRMNYYAVKAYIARVSLYTGDTKTALEYARAVVKETQMDNKWFPFVTRADASTASKWDRIYQTEILFGMYNLKRNANVYQTSFTNSLGPKVILAPTKENIDALYEEDTRVVDWRYNYQWSPFKDPEGEDKTYFVKYMSVDDTDDNGVSRGYTYIMPLMRISEMHLVIAECTGDTEEAYDHLDRVREGRGVGRANRELDIMHHVEAEFRREFIGEGQLFWFYKRQNRTAIPSCRDYTKTVAMEESYYLFDMPQAEKDGRTEDI